MQYTVVWCCPLYIVAHEHSDLSLLIFTPHIEIHVHLGTCYYSMIPDQYRLLVLQDVNINKCSKTLLVVEQKYLNVFTFFFNSPQLEEETSVLLVMCWKVYPETFQDELSMSAYRPDEAPQLLLLSHPSAAINQLSCRPLSAVKTLRLKQH